MSQALKHIGSLEVPGKSHVYGKSGLQDVIEGLETAGTLRWEGELREGGRGREREREGGRGREREREGGRGREREGGREVP